MANRFNGWGGIRRIASALAVVALCVPLVGCGPEFTYVYMAKDSGGDQKTTRFLSVGDEIHCVMEVIGGDEDTVVRLDLLGPDGLTMPDDEYFPHPQGNQGPVALDVQMFTIDVDGVQSTTGPWVVGGYTIDVLLDGASEEVLEFEVLE